MSQYRWSCRRRDAGVVLGLALELLLASVNVKFRMLLNPGMVERRVVGDEIEQQSEPAFMQAAAKPFKSGIAAKIRMNDVRFDGEERPANIPIPKVWKECLKLGAPGGVLQRDLSAGGSSLPHAKKPHPIEAAGEERIEFPVRNIVERCPSA